MRKCAVAEVICLFVLPITIDYKYAKEGLYPFISYAKSTQPLVMRHHFNGRMVPKKAGWARLPEEAGAQV